MVHNRQQWRADHSFAFFLVRSMLGLGFVLVFMPEYLNNILVALGLLVLAVGGTALIVALERLY